MIMKAGYIISLAEGSISTEKLFRQARTPPKSGFCDTVRSSLNRWACVVFANAEDMFCRACRAADIPNLLDAMDSMNTSDPMRRYVVDGDKRTVRALNLFALGSPFEFPR